jgi:hypothetical protein
MSVSLQSEMIITCENDGMVDFCASGIGHGQPWLGWSASQVAATRLQFATSSTSRVP